MPKTLVLFDTRDAETARLAAEVAEGARSVRFAEVDLVDVARLGGDEAFAVYDGLIVDASSRAVLEVIGRAGPLRSKVGGLFGGSDASVQPLMEALARAGVIILPPGAGAGALTAIDVESARLLGKRLADVVGWITHARSHHHH